VIPAPAVIPNPDEEDDAVGECDVISCPFVWRDELQVPHEWELETTPAARAFGREVSVHLLFPWDLSHCYCFIQVMAYTLEEIATTSLLKLCDYTLIRPVCSVSSCVCCWYFQSVMTTLRKWVGCLTSCDVQSFSMKVLLTSPPSPVMVVGLLISQCFSLRRSRKSGTWHVKLTPRDVFVRLYKLNIYWCCLNYWRLSSQIVVGSY
jgi:hypothetical protein